LEKIRGRRAGVLERLSGRLRQKKNEKRK